jgi:biotin carboxyl carrier protein
MEIDSGHNSKFILASLFLRKIIMIHATVNQKATFDLEISDSGNQISVNGAPVTIDRKEVEKGHFHLLKDNRSYNAEVISLNKEEKRVVVKVNGQSFSVQLKDRFDDLLKSLGMESTGAAKLKEIKAPMPGMVLQILVEADQEVEKDTPLIILEAMKMENVIKAPAAGKVKRVATEKGIAVEKNALLIEFHS